ncbi:hypothetical protein [Jannaschia sp. R86511]|uniref:hypothetical protein n=1 Tax=Jannaschia sp. R86511 TaxID=3093853 RepID=UPI0036D20B35
MSNLLTVERSLGAGPIPADHADVGHDDILVTPGPAPTWDEAALIAAASSARDAVAAFTSDADDAVWWTTVSPLLSPTAQQAYVATDPAEVPGSTVLDVSTVLDAGSAYLARVLVPTDAGDYEVLLSRTESDAPWLVERFGLPASVRAALEVAP